MAGFVVEQTPPHYLAREILGEGKEDRDEPTASVRMSGGFSLDGRVCIEAAGRTLAYAGFPLVPK